jgi:uncharacterized membrane protein YccC
MTASSPTWHGLDRLVNRDTLRPDLARATRSTVAFMLPLALAAAGWLSIPAAFVALAAQNVAMIDVRGSYALRFGLLLAMVASLAVAAGVGSLASGHLVAAVACTGVLALFGGAWRHLSAEYGTSVAISSALVYFIAVASPPGAANTGQHVTAALAGGVWGLLLQMSQWPFRPQHPLRRATADSWLAVADLFAALTPGEPAEAAGRHLRIAECEANLRTTLDKTQATLAASVRAGPLRPRLEELNLGAARLATRVAAFNTALESLMARPVFASLAPSLAPVLRALTNTSRTVALAVVSRQPSHLATAEVRLRRLANLLQVLRTHVTALAGGEPGGGQLVEILRQVERLLPLVREALRATVDRAGEQAAFSVELFDLDTWTLRPLASALNFSRQVDPALVRFTLRIAVLTMAGVVVFKWLGLPHGYWLPFTMVVVLQPDYGSTRQRAAQRVLGTLAGSLAASGLLWVRPPPAVLLAATAVCAFAFAFLLKRRYGVAVVFVTLFVVLLTEAESPVTLAFTAERMGSTLAGGALALAAALFFWPVWERDRLPPVLARALRANRDYWTILSARLAEGGAYDAEVIRRKRAAEAANSAMFSSLQRLMGDPKHQQAGLAGTAALANGNQRITRALSVVALHLTPGQPLNRPNFLPFTAQVTATLESLAQAVETGALAARPDVAGLEQLRLPPPGDGTRDPAAQRDHWVFAQYTQAATELAAMLLAAAPAESEPGSGVTA